MALGGLSPAVAFTNSPPFAHVANNNPIPRSDICLGNHFVLKAHLALLCPALIHAVTLVAKRSSVVVRVRRARRAKPRRLKLHVGIHGVPAHSGCAGASSGRVLRIDGMNLHRVSHARFARAGFLQDDIAARRAEKRSVTLDVLVVRVFLRERIRRQILLSQT